MTEGGLPQDLGCNTKSFNTMPRYELWQISAKPTITWRSQVLVTVNANSTAPSGAADRNASSNAAAALCIFW